MLKKYNIKNPYYQNPKKTSKGNLQIKTKLLLIPLTQVVTCYKCRQVGHKAHKCPLKEKIMKLKDKMLQEIILSLLIHDDSEEALYLFEPF